MLVEILIIISGIYMGWNIGANDAANCVGASVGCKKVTMREGIIITSIFSFLGAVLFGGNVIKTVGKGIVPLNDIVSGRYVDLGISPQAGLYMIAAAAFAAGIWVMMATYLKLPVSTSHAVVGAVAGTGVAFLGDVPGLVMWSKLGSIFISWITTPIGAAILAFALYKPIDWLFRALVPEKHEKLAIRILLLAMSIYLSFTWGANDVANATGLIAGTGLTLMGTPITIQIAAIVGGIAIIIGITTWGWRIIETIGCNITNLVPIMTITAQLASSINVTAYTILGMPVSTTHSIVGAVAGVGLWHGIKGVNSKVIRDIALACVGTPFISGIISFIIFKAILFLGIVGQV